jgi:FkbM family methyltransferase
VRLFQRLYRFLENKYYAKTAPFTKGWRIHFSRTLDISLLLNLDHYIDYFIFRHDVFEPSIIGAIRHYLQQEKVAAFVDVGSNIGQMSLYVARHFPAVRVVSYEAVPQTHAQQVANMLINNLYYELHNRAVTEKAQAVTLFLPERDPAADFGKLNPGMASILAAQGPSEPIAVVVEGVSLGEEFDRMGFRALKGYLLLKIDVEGGELAVLEGLKPYLLEGPGLIILVEMLFAHHPASCRQAVDLLLGHEFRMYGLEGRPISGVEEVDEAETDFVFVREEFSIDVIR